MATSREMTEGRALPLISTLLCLYCSAICCNRPIHWWMQPSWGAFWVSTPWLQSGQALRSFSYSGILQWLLRRFRHSRGAKVRCAGLCHDAPLCGCQPAAGCGDVCCHCRGYQHLLCRYSAHDEYAGEHIHGSLLLPACHVYRGSLYFLL